MDDLVNYIQAVIKTNDKDTELCKMALLAEQFLVNQAYVDETISSIVGEE